MKQLALCLPQLLASIGLALLVSCASGEPAVQEDDVLTISASPSSITNFGDSSIVTVRLFQSNGQPVPDGARIFLSADGGTIIDEVRIVDGRAQTPFFSDANTGTVTITAQSGTLGLDGSITTQIEVIDRAVEIGGVVLSINPNNIGRSGGRITLSGTVFDPNGDPIAGRVAVFSSQYGTLASNGALLRTDNRGQVFDVLDIGRLPEEVSSIDITVDVTGVTATKTLSVTDNQSPTAAFAYSPQDVREGESVFFDASESEDPDGTIATYSWNLGDGTIQTGRQVTHTYALARSYRVLLTVTDDQGATHTVAETIDVGDNQPPVAAFTVSPDGPRANQVLTLDASAANDPDGEIVAYDWTLGNGGARQGRVVSAAYSGAGTYTITLTVTDDKGETGTIAMPITITGNQPPSAVIEASSVSVRIGESVTFNGNESSDPDGLIDSYLWQFGDTFTDSGAVTSYAWFQPGDYIVVLTVTDNEGAQGFSSVTINVADNEPPQPAFVFSPTTPRVFELVTFNAETSTDPDGTIEEYRWSFGDGTLGNGISVQHRYEAGGQYTVFLEVRDNDGAGAFTERPIVVNQGNSPRAALDIDPTSLPPEGGTVVLDASGSTDTEDPDALRYFFDATPATAITITQADRQAPVALATVGALEDGARVVFGVDVRDPQDNGDRASATLSITDTQINLPPQPSLDISPDLMVVTGGTVILDASATTDPDSELADLDFSFSSQSAGGVVVSEPEGTGFLQTVTVSPPMGENVIDVNARVVFILVVTDETEEVGSAQAVLTFTEGSSGNAPVAALTTDPVGPIEAPMPGETVQIVLDGRDSNDQEDGDALTYAFSAKRNGDPAFTVDPVEGDPRLALASFNTLAAGDFLIFTLTVTDSDGLTDTASVTVAVVDP